jgi:hypothetical protein
MRKILLSAICVLATVVSAAKTIVMAKTDSWELINNDNFGAISTGYSFDFGYGGSNSYEVDEETKIVSYSAAFGLTSSLDLVLSMNLFGLFYRNFKISVTPFAFNPISVSASWTHPIAVSQGEDMSSTIDIGYDLAVGDVQLYTYMDDIVPSVSILDYIQDSNTKLYPTSLADLTLLALTLS